MRSIIKTDMKVRQTECRIAGDKAMIKGELCVRALYIADNEIGECVVTEFVIPVGQVIDAAGIETIQNRLPPAASLWRVQAQGGRKRKHHLR